MKIFYITGNEEKFRETKLLIPEIEQLEIDLPEIQEIDSQKIIEAKLIEARRKTEERFFVDDASFYLEAMGGLPGPLIKWFMKTIGNDGLYRIAECYGNFNASAKLTIGYSDENGNMHFFTGEVKGTIVKPRGEIRFGWDPVFKPEGYDKTYAEMGIEEKNKISHRRLALDNLKKFLNQDKF